MLVWRSEATPLVSRQAHVLQSNGVFEQIFLTCFVKSFVGNDWLYTVDITFIFPYNKKDLKR